MKLKKKSNAKLKKELDKIFSEYIRKSSSNKSGRSRCYTCDKEADWRQLQCGHFISRSYLSTRFDEDNCRSQCVGCNIFGGGKPVEFARKLEKENKGIVQKLYKKAQEIVRYFPYEEKIEYYKQKIKEL